MFDVFTTVVYQPFLNVLVFFYWFLDLIPTVVADMGVAVILLTLLIRVILFPLSIASHRSEEERREIAAKVKHIEDEFAADPVKIEQKKREVLRGNRRIVVSEIITLTIQVIIALMLWRIFNTGLSGQDLHLIYSFMPDVSQPFNLVFLGEIDLTATSWKLNLLQSFLIFILETLLIYTSPYPTTRSQVVRLQLVLPVVSFLVFMALPAGKKLFIITTLSVSIVLTLVRAVRKRFRQYAREKEQQEQQKSEVVVSEV